MAESLAGRQGWHVRLLVLVLTGFGSPSWGTRASGLPGSGMSQVVGSPGQTLSRAPVAVAHRGWHPRSS